MTKQHITLAVAAAAVAALAIGGVVLASRNDDGSSSSADHTQADITFAQGMIPHHEQAIAMAELADGRSTNPQVQDIADRIVAAQDPEIERLRGFLDTYGADESSSGGHGGHGGDSGAEGMATDDELTQLEQAQGPAFDREFIRLMIAHHEGAITMARTELEDGEHEPARELARDVIEAQSAEITELRAIQP